MSAIDACKPHRAPPVRTCRTAAAPLDSFVPPCPCAIVPSVPLRGLRASARSLHLCDLRHLRIGQSSSLRCSVAALCLPPPFSLRSAWRSAVSLGVFSLFSRAQRVPLFSLSVQPTSPSCLRCPRAFVPACLSGFLTFLTFSHVSLSILTFLSEPACASPNRHPPPDLRSDIGHPSHPPFESGIP